MKIISQGSTAIVATCALALATGGLFLIGIAVSGAAVANASGKVQVIKEEMARRKKKDKLKTRPEDVFEGIAWGSTSIITAPIENMVGAAMLQPSSGVTSYHGLTYNPSLDYFSRVER